MKQVFSLPRMTAIVLSLLCLLPVQTTRAQGPIALNVKSAVICREVVNRQPVEASTNFPNTVGKLYCFTKILGASNSSSVTHVWYYGNAEQFRISLPVKSPSWRTYSSKTIRAHETGVWHVDIIDEEGNKLEVINFHITKK